MLLKSKPLELKAIIYDLDGTLVDSCTDAALGHLHGILSLNGYSLDAGVRERLRAGRGMHGVSYLRHALNVDAAEAARLYALWELQDGAPPFVKGALHTVRRLSMAGYHSCLLTSRSRSSAVRWLRDPAFQGFAVTTCAEDTVFHKPDGRAFERTLYTLAHYGIGPEHCLYVGDTAADIQAGKAAGVRTLVVETGPYRESHAHLHPVPCEDILPSVAHLPGWIARRCARAA